VEGIDRTSGMATEKLPDRNAGGDFLLRRGSLDPLLPARAHDFTNAKHLLAVFARPPRNGDRVADLQGIRSPAGVVPPGRRCARLGNPYRQVARRVLHFEIQMGMGTDKSEFRYGSLKCDQFVRLVLRRRVMREDQDGRHQQADHYRQNG